MTPPLNAGPGPFSSLLAGAKHTGPFGAGWNWAKARRCRGCRTKTTRFLGVQLVSNFAFCQGAKRGDVAMRLEEGAA